MTRHGCQQEVPRVILAGVILVLAACGGDDRTSGSTTVDASTTSSTVVADVCPDPIAVGDADDLLAVLEAEEWGWEGPYSSGSLPATPDLVVGGTISLESADVPVPADCLDRDDCRHQAVFAVADWQGATVEGDTDLFEGDARLILTSTTVRIRLSMLDTHPGPFNYVPLVSVFRPCGAPCDPDQLSCPADGGCYGSFDAFCRHCEGRAANECACRTPDGLLDEGEFCQYFVSGDVIEVGRCRAGVCDVED
jgi:hypothetical protein